MGSRATLHELKEDEYEAEIAKCMGVTGFHRWFFLSALSESLGFRMRAFAVEKGGATIGVLPMIVDRRGPVAVSNYLPVPHVGPLLRDATYLTDVLAAAAPYLRRQLTVALKWAFAPGVRIAAESLAGLGLQVTVDENFFVPAGKTPADHLASMNGRLRTYIKEGQSRGMTAEPADIQEIRGWFADQVVSTYERSGASPYSRDACHLLVDLLGMDSRMLWRSLRDKDGQLIAVTANIIDVDRLWLWMLTGKHGTQPTPHLMAYWDIFDWSLSRGLACDVGGPPTPGIRTFKLRLGTTSETCLIAEGGPYQRLHALQSRIATRLPGRTE